MLLYQLLNALVYGCDHKAHSGMLWSTSASRCSLGSSTVLDTLQCPSMTSTTSPLPHVTAEGTSCRHGGFPFLQKSLIKIALCRIGYKTKVANSNSCPPAGRRGQQAERTHGALGAEPGPRGGSCFRPIGCRYRADTVFFLKRRYVFLGKSHILMLATN